MFDRDESRAGLLLTLKKGLVMRYPAPERAMQNGEANFALPVHGETAPIWITSSGAATPTQHQPQSSTPGTTRSHHPKEVRAILEYNEARVNAMPTASRADSEMVRCFIQYLSACDKAKALQFGGCPLATNKG